MLVIDWKTKSFLLEFDFKITQGISFYIDGTQLLVSGWRSGEGLMSPPQYIIKQYIPTTDSSIVSLNNKREFCVGSITPNHIICSSLHKNALVIFTKNYRLGN